MKFRFRVLPVGLLAVAVLAGVRLSTVAQDSARILRVDARDPEHTVASFGRWNSALREETGGAWGVAPTQSRRNEEQRLAGVLSGEIGIAQIFFSTLDEAAPSLKAFESSFVFQDEGHVSWAAENAGVLEKPSQELAARGLRLLGVGYNGGFLQILSAGRKLRRLENFAGLRVGDGPGRDRSGAAAPPLPVTAKFFSHLGASIVPWLPDTEAEDGEFVRGYFIKEGAALQGKASFLREMTAFALGKKSWELPLAPPGRGPLSRLTLNETNHAVILSAFVTSERFFQNLPAAHRAALVKTAMSHAREERRILGEMDARALRLFKKDGWRHAVLPARERARLTRASRALDGHLSASARATLELILAAPPQVRAGIGPANSSRPGK